MGPVEQIALTVKIPLPMRSIRPIFEERYRDAAEGRDARKVVINLVGKFPLRQNGRNLAENAERFISNAGFELRYRLSDGDANPIK